MITIDYTDRTPIYEQIVHSIERLIALGVLVPDEKLPSVRSLGIELSTNHNTVQKAYTLLEQRGSVYSVKGIGNFVSKTDVKSIKIKECFEEAEKYLRAGIAYGLEEEEFINWIEEKRREFYDYRNKHSEDV